MAAFRLPSPIDPSIARATRALFRSWHFRGWMVFALLLTAILVQLPLFGVLGFELGLVGAGLGSLVGLFLGAALVRRAQLTQTRPLDRAVPPVRLVLSLAWRAVLAPLAVVAVPFAGAALHGLWAPTCDWLYGLEAYGILALASTVLASLSGAFVAMCTGPRRRLLIPAILAVIVGIAGAGFYRFYSEPPVFSYNALIGFFPGNLYDEDIRLAGALYWSRLEQLAVVLALLGAATVLLDAPSLRVRVLGRRHRPAFASLWLAVPATLLALVLHYYSATLGYAIDAEDIWAELGGVRRTKHFVIHYDDRPSIAEQMDLYAEDHEFRLAQLCEKLDLDIDKIGTIHSYVFASDEQKGRLMGARRVEMAKPWRREIYLTFGNFPHRSLRHEIAHVVAGTFGSPIFHVSAQRVVLINPGMIEGLAVAADWPGREALTPHQSVRAMELLGMAPSARAVFGLSFLTLSSQRAYTSAGSFMHFLYERHGAERLKRLYATGGDFEQVYETSQGRLVAEWREMIGRIEVPAADMEAARERFRQPGVFQRPCPHANAARIHRAGTLPHAQAVRLIREVCKDAPDDPRFRLRLARELDEGDADEIAEARAIYESFAGAERGQILAAEALESLVELDGKRGDWAAVRHHVDRALAFALDDETRRWFLGADLALRAEGFRGYFLRGYFFAENNFRWAMLAALVGGDGFSWYLTGLQAHAGGQHGMATIALTIALDRGLPAPAMVRNAARRLAVSAWRARDAAALDRATASLDTSAYETDHLLAADWRQRARITSR